MRQTFFTTVIPLIIARGRDHCHRRKVKKILLLLWMYAVILYIEEDIEALQSVTLPAECC